MKGWFRKRQGCPHRKSGSCLADILPGQRVIIIGHCDGGQKRLYGMGLVPGVDLKVLFNDGSGAMMVQTGNKNISICPSLSRRIFVNSISVS